MARCATFSQGKKKPGNPHLRGPSGFSKPPKMVGRVGFNPSFQLLIFLLLWGQRLAQRSDALALFLNVVNSAAQR
jgi:hypothetical protein